jgi:hypothetical protein
MFGDEVDQIDGWHSLRTIRLNVLREVDEMDEMDGCHSLRAVWFKVRR